jgi:hypothetical protein
MRRYKQLKISEAASGIPRAVIVTGVLGILVTLLEGMLQLNQYHETGSGMVDGSQVKQV